MVLIMKMNVQTLCTMRIIGSYTFQPLWFSGCTCVFIIVFYGVFKSLETFTSTFEIHSDFETSENTTTCLFSHLTINIELFIATVYLFHKYVGLKQATK